MGCLSFFCCGCTDPSPFAHTSPLTRIENQDIPGLAPVDPPIPNRAVEKTEHAAAERPSENAANDAKEPPPRSAESKPQGRRGPEREVKVTWNPDHIPSSALVEGSWEDSSSSSALPAPTPPIGSHALPETANGTHKHARGVDGASGGDDEARLDSWARGVRGPRSLPPPPLPLALSISKDGFANGIHGGQAYNREELGESLKHEPSLSSARQATHDLRASPAACQPRALPVRSKNVDGATMMMEGYPVGDQLERSRAIHRGGYHRPRTTCRRDL